MSGMTPVATARTVWSEIEFEVTEPAQLVVQVTAAAGGGELTVLNNLVPLEARHIGGGQRLVESAPGSLTIRYAATVHPDQQAEQTAEQAVEHPVTPFDRVVALRPSRYCPSDRLLGFAGSHFGRYAMGLDRIRAICDHVSEHVSYESGASDGTTDATQTLLTGRGVCRDFALLVAALCRALDVPARVAAVYAPGLSPMDFHLVVETEVDGAWRVWDATRLAPRPSLVRIATGRDAADVAFSTILSGRAELTGLQILAVVDGDLPDDDHLTPVTLR
jgi:transglutaminase-like putative cysteine protease